MPSYGSIFFVLCTWTLFVGCRRLVNIGEHAMLNIKIEPTVVILFWVQCLHIPSCIQVYTKRNVDTIFFFVGGCPFYGEQKNIVKNLNHVLRRSFCSVSFKQGESKVKGNCKKNAPFFQSSCPPFLGLQGFFYCNVTGRGVKLAARSKIVDPLSLSGVRSCTFFSAEFDVLKYPFKVAHLNF